MKVPTEGRGYEDNLAASGSPVNSAGQEWNVQQQQRNHNRYKSERRRGRKFFLRDFHSEEPLRRVTEGAVKVPNTLSTPLAASGVTGSCLFSSCRCSGFMWIEYPILIGSPQGGARERLCGSRKPFNGVNKTEQEQGRVGEEESIGSSGRQMSRESRGTRIHVLLPFHFRGRQGTHALLTLPLGKHPPPRDLDPLLFSSNQSDSLSIHIPVEVRIIYSPQCLQIRRIQSFNTHPPPHLETHQPLLSPPSFHEEGNHGQLSEGSAASKVTVTQYPRSLHHLHFLVLCRSTRV